MGPITSAFSVHDFISSVGADAGFASIIGLAILVLLYFAQARETTSLREELTDAAQRVQQLETRLTQLGRGAPAPAPAPYPASGSAPRQHLPPPAPAAAAPAATPAVPPPPPAPAAGQPGGATAVADRPGAPAGVGAPALSAATRLIPGSPLAPAHPGEQPSATPAPVTAAGGGNGTAQPAPARAPAQAPPRIQMRPGAPRRPDLAPRLTPPREPSASRARRVFIAVIALLALAVVVVGLLVLTSSGGGSTSATHTAPVSNAPVVHHHARRRTPSAANVTVAVLNGTATSGLAHRVAQKLSGGGYKQGTVATATDQTHTTTVVAYMPGHQHDAAAVAATLKLGAASVTPLDQSTQAVACPPPGACNATVIVTVGSDLASIH